MGSVGRDRTQFSPRIKLKQISPQDLKHGGIMNKYNELLLNKLEEVKEIDNISLLQNIKFLREFIRSNLDATLEDVGNIELLVEDFIKWFAYSRELLEREGK